MQEASRGIQSATVDDDYHWLHIAGKGNIVFITGQVKAGRQAFFLGYSYNAKRNLWWDHVVTKLLIKALAFILTSVIL